MDENTNLNVDTGVEQDNTDTTTDTNTDENVSMTKVDYDKAIQAAEDRVRSKLSKEIRDLKAQLPVQKSKAEIELENRLADIEAKQQLVETKEKDLIIRAALQEANLDKSIADFVKTDIDINVLCTTIDKIVNDRIVTQGYVPPNGHTNNTGITKEQLTSMKYSEMEEMIQKNPELINLLK